jgi:hypothetical protein
MNLKGFANFFGTKQGLCLLPGAFGPRLMLPFLQLYVKSAYYFLLIKYVFKGLGHGREKEILSRSTCRVLSWISCSLPLVLSKLHHLAAPCSHHAELAARALRVCCVL